MIAVSVRAERKRSGRGKAPSPQCIWGVNGMQDKGGTDHRTQIIVAVIELAGVLGTTAIANFPLLLEVFGVSAPQRHEAGGHRGQPPGPGAGFGGDGRGASVAGNRSPSAADRLQIRPSVAPRCGSSRGIHSR